MAKHVGTSPRRYEDPRFLQGKGRYVANVQLPGMAHVAFLRSPYAHAKINSINTDKAAALEGVVAVFTGQDLVDSGLGPLISGFNVPDQKNPPFHQLAVGTVRYVGEGVAAVVAETPYIAADALQLIEVDYESLPVEVNARAAIADGAPQLHDVAPDNICFHWPLGDQEAMEKAFAEADHVVELDLVNQRLIPNAMEPRAAVAQWNSINEEMTLWTTSQHIHITRVVMSAFTLGIPEHKLRLLAPDVGGGFGSKLCQYAEEDIMAWIARELNRPVKWVATRSESFVTDRQGRDHITEARLALKSDGTITGIHVKTWANLGAYVALVGTLIPTALYLTSISGMYKIPGVFGESWGVFTNTVPTSAYRGAGRPESQYLVERLVDVAARELNMDPIEIRRKNFIPADEFPYQTPVAVVYDSGDYDGVFDKLVELSDYDKMRQDQEAARQDGRLVGVGVSGCLELCGLSPSEVTGSLGFAVGQWEAADIRVHPTGKVTLHTGVQPQGQGHETTFAQVTADELGVNPADIDVIYGDTAAVSQGNGTYGSRSASVGLPAIAMAAEKIRAKAKKLAAHLLEASEEDMVFDQDEGKLYVKGSPDKSLGIGEVSFAAYTAHNLPEGMEPGLEAHAYFNPPNFTFPFAAHIAQVEIDRDTGEVTLQRYIGADDCGVIINPMIVEGQVMGGITQSVGQALSEHAVYDENGQLLTGSMMDYALPRADDVPNFELGFTETPSPTNSLGVKGIGEMGTIVALPTLANAVMDALAPFGIKHLDTPLTPEKIWQAMQSSKNGG